MIRIFEGVPGSGKTYAMVYYLSKFCKWDDFYKEWTLDKDTIIITNIEDLKIPHINFDKLLEELSLKDIFSEKFVKSLWERGYKKIIFCIDEAQKYFDRKFYDKDVFFFFQYHRHYGVDILLATQDASVLPKEIRVLAEFLIRAEQRSLTLASFKYKFYTPDGKTHLFNQTLRKDKKIFALYKSFHMEEVEKPKKVLIRQLIIPIFVFFGFIFFAWYYVTHLMFPKPEKSEPAKTVAKQQPVTPSPPIRKEPIQKETVKQPYYSYVISGYAITPEGRYFFVEDVFYTYLYRDRYGNCVINNVRAICFREPELIRVFRREPSSLSSPSGEIRDSGLVDVYSDNSQNANTDIRYAADYSAKSPQ